MEYSERNVDGTMRWVQKIVLMSESMVYDKVSEKEKEYSAWHGSSKNTTDLHRAGAKELDRLKAAWEECGYSKPGKNRIFAG